MTDTPRMAAILIRGPVHVDAQIHDTLHRLRLRNKHACVVVPSNSVFNGMLSHCRDYITWGEIKDETMDALTKARGKNATGKDGKTYTKPFFRLHPPRGGFERKGIKVSFTNGGSLGYRGPAINELIKKML